MIHSRRASSGDEAGREARCAQRQDAEPRPYSNGLKAVWNGRRCAQLIGLENAEGRHVSASREYSRNGAWIRPSEWWDRHLRCAMLVSVMETTDFGNGDDLSVAWWLDRSAVRRVFA